MNDELYDLGLLILSKLVFGDRSLNRITTLGTGDLKPPFALPTGTVYSQPGFQPYVIQEDGQPLQKQ